MNKPIHINIFKFKIAFENSWVFFAVLGLMVAAFGWGVYQGFSAGAAFFGQKI